MLSQLKQAITRAWYSGHPAFYLLWPFSWFYALAHAVKSHYYRRKPNPPFAVPVIVIGNISVGGTGKTPLLIALVELLQAHGYRPGVVSRGYGGDYARMPCQVSKTSQACEVGDEPLLIFQRTGVPVVVAPNRVQAASKLLQETHCNLILSDDGLQHYALPRDIEIAVVDSTRPLDKARRLPAGPLREPWSRLKSVDFIVANGKAKSGQHEMCYVCDELYNLRNFNQRLSLEALVHKKIHAFAGIGNPSRFFNQLKKLGIKVIEHPFSDHYQYKVEDFYFNDDLMVVMTEKDAVKCRDFGKDNHWVLPIKARLSETFIRKLLETVQALGDGTHEKTMH